MLKRNQLSGIDDFSDFSPAIAMYIISSDTDMHMNAANYLIRCGPNRRISGFGVFDDIGEHVIYPISDCPKHIGEFDDLGAGHISTILFHSFRAF